MNDWIPGTYAKIMGEPLPMSALTFAIHSSFLRLPSTRIVGTKGAKSNVTPGAGERLTPQLEPKAIFLLSLKNLLKSLEL